MKLRIVLLTVALAAASLTGCIGAKTDEPVDGSNVDDSEPSGEDVDIDKLYPRPDPKTPLDVTVATSEQWIKPGTTVTLSAEAPEGATVQYFLEKRVAPSADPHAGHNMGGGEEEAEADPHAGHGGGGDGGMDMIDTGDIAPGVAAEPFTLDNAGWYTFHCHPHPWMKLNITVVDGAATTGTVHVAAVNDEGDESFRFYPEELEVAPGTEVVFWNNGTVVHTIMQEAFRTYLGEGASVDVAPEDVGDWNVVALATDGENGWGEARTRLVVDGAKPAESKTWDPMTGSSTGGFPGNPSPEEKRHSFLAEWDMATTTIKFQASSSAPEPQIKVSVAPQGGEVVAESEAASSGEITVEDLPAGTYTVIITVVQGALVDYEVVVDADFNLVPPEDYKPSAGEGHGDHGGGGGHDH